MRGRALAGRAAGLGLLLAVVLAGCPRCGADAADPKKAGTTGPLLSVDGTRLTYDGRPLPLPGPLDDWTAVLGTPRFVQRMDDTYVWDAHGLSVGCPHGTRLVTDLEVALQPQSRSGEVFEHWPRTPFPGRLVVDGAWVHPGARISDINAHTRGPGFSEGYLPHIFSYTLPFPGRKDGSIGFRIDLGRDRRPNDFSMSLDITSSNALADAGTPDAGSTRDAGSTTDAGR